MSIEENYLSLYTALYKAISDHRFIGDLLQHPEFKRKAGHICREIAGPADAEELFRETCLRLLEQSSQLDPDSIRGEGEFFGWLTQLARHVHLSKLLTAAAVNSCTDGTGRWPDTSADVPPDYMGHFLSHADACPYHTRILRAEEESLRTRFSRARGLDSQGRILLGDELDATVAEHKRRLQGWHETACVKGEPFGHVSLYNGGREVASCGKFYDFSIHKSKNELDPRAGLQIFGVSSGKPDESVLLGFYALEDVCHESEELAFELGNGYTLGLKVNQLSETTFDIHFRCVETGTLSEPVEIDGDTDGITEETPEVEVPTSPVVPVTPKSSGWWPQLRGSQPVAFYAIALLIAVQCFLLGWTGALMADAVAGRASADMVRVEVPGRGWDREQEPAAQVKGVRPAPSPQDQQSLATGGAPQIRTAADPGPAAVARLTQEPGQEAKAQPETRTRGGNGRKVVGDKKLEAFVKNVLPGSGHTNSQGTSPNEVSTFQLLSHEERGLSTLNITTDPLLNKQLVGALQGEGLHVTGVEGEHEPDVRYTIKWDAKSEPKAVAKLFVVTVKANIIRRDENFFRQLPSYEGEGSSLIDAYDAALEKAVKPVVAQIRREDEEDQQASTQEPAIVESQPVIPIQSEEIICAY